MKLQKLLLCIALTFFQLLSAQTFELHNSINFSDLNDGRDIPDGITWFKPSSSDYGIYRTSGAWTGPNYQQLKISFDTGIIIDGGFGHGRSGTVLQPNGGNVGIGTINASAPLTVYGKSLFFPARIGSGDARSFEIGNTFQFPNFINNDYPVFLKTGGGNQPLILDAARVGIGTANPSSMLTVAGTIASREVQVTVNAGADFVFEDNYNLPSLETLDKYIKENKHLPEIASAEEMKKDGINLSEMNIKLLQKIEELTLYTIEQHKELERLKLENENYKSLTERLSAIEKELKK